MKTAILNICLGILLWVVSFGIWLGCLLNILPQNLIRLITQTPLVLLLMTSSYFAIHFGAYFIHKGIHIIRFGPLKSHPKLA